MNKRQKEVIQTELNDEKKVLNELKKVYEQAEKDVVEQIKSLEARTDVENLQSIVYQKQYQEALKKQLDAILDTMNSNQFTTISDYLTGCYETGYVGTMYDLHGQGIPLTTPINQKQVAKAVQIDSKISEGLYTRLGVNTKMLKNSIRANVSRGIAASESWADVSRNISNRMGIDRSKSMRIARTEGHRILCESAYDAQIDALNNGAEIVKQWDATLDKRTRPSHAALDGKLVQADEKFKSPETGAEALYPGAFGVASEDINCRCAILQRAKWALDEEELEELQFRSVAFGLDKTADFEDFKKKYLTVSGKTDTIENDTIDVTKTTTKMKSEMSKADYEEYLKLINDSPELQRLYSHADEVAKFTVSEKGYYAPIDNELHVSYPKKRYVDTGLNRYSTIAHEYGHFFDHKVSTDGLHWNEYNAVTNACTYKTGIHQIISTSDEWLSAIRKDKIGIKALLTQDAKVDMLMHDSSSGVQDAIDGFGFGIIGWGHGDKYYNRKYNSYKLFGDEKNLQTVYKELGLDASNQTKTKSICRDYETASELWANVMSAITCNGDSLNYVKKYLPNSYEEATKILKGIK